MCWLTWHPEQRRMPERPSCNLLIYGRSTSLSLSDLTSKGWIKNAIMLGKQIYCCKWLCKFFFYSDYVQNELKVALGAIIQMPSDPHTICYLRFLLSNVSVYYNTRPFQRGTRWLRVSQLRILQQKEEGIWGYIWFWWNWQAIGGDKISVFKEGSHLQ